VDPRVSCPDPVLEEKNFPQFRNQIERIREKWHQFPVYITEFNTHGFGATEGPHQPGWTPRDNYPAHWDSTNFMKAAYEEVRNYNKTFHNEMPNYPKVRCLCWFVDRKTFFLDNPSTDWLDYSLSQQQGNLALARADFVQLSPQEVESGSND
jgi:hypothetical protein